MAFTWRESDVPVRNPEADFRINTVSRAIAQDLQVPQDDIWWLLVVQPSDGVSLDELVKRAGYLGLGDDPTAYLAIPPEYPSGDFRERPTEGPVTLYARRRYIDAANKNGDEAGIDWLEVGAAFRPTDLIIQEGSFAPPDPETVYVPNGSVVVAVIDNGMAVGHNLFRYTDGAGDPVSRVAFFWDMDAALQKLEPPATVTEPTSVGRGWTKDELSTQLKENMHNGLLDDQAFYSSIGVTDWAIKAHTPVAHRLSHGTHVMGLCAGYPTDTATDPTEAEKRPIIAVNLRTADVQKSSGELIAPWLEQALFYIQERYKRFQITGHPGKKPPLVINFSFGNYAGPHDGTGIFETIIKKALSKAKQENKKCQFVLPAGNSNQSRCHARIELSNSAPRKTLDWRVQPSDRSTSAVQIWLDKKGQVDEDYVTLTVKGPGGIAPVSIGCVFSQGGFLALPQELKNEDGEKIGQVHFLAAGNGGYKRGHFGIELYSTASPADVGPFTPAGLWQLTLESGTGAGDVGLNAWVARDETLPGFAQYGRQSYFDDPDYARFYEPGVAAYNLDQQLIGGLLGYDPVHTSALVRRNGTISGFAGGKKTIVIGGFVEAASKCDSPMGLYSSTGLTLNGRHVYPDASARSDASAVMHGVLSAGSASGSFVAMPGTSVAAPQVTRWVAGRLADKKKAGPKQVRAKAKANEQSCTPNPMKPPHFRSGGGRMLDLENLFGRSRWPGQSD